MKKILVVCFYFLFLTFVASVSVGSKENEWKKDTRWDDFIVIMWEEDPLNNAAYFDSLYEMGLKAGMLYSSKSPSVFHDYNFLYYATNMANKLHIRNKTFPNLYKKFKEDRSKKWLARDPCLSDEKYLLEEGKRVEEITKRTRKDLCIGYDLRDEASLTRNCWPFDFCFSEYCLKKFKEYIKDKYQTLDSLNKEWETNFKSWDEVEPFTTDEIQEREYKKPESANFSPWADHRSFMDDVWVDTIKYFKDIVCKVNPDALVGISGTQMPSIWGGFDFYKLMQVCSWVEHYDIRGSREMMRSFAKPNTVFVAAISNPDDESKKRLWSNILHGDRGVLVWPYSGENMSNNLFINEKKEGISLTQRGKKLKEIVWEIRCGVVPLLSNSNLECDPIAIHHSQSSIQADWLFEVKREGKDWISRTTYPEMSINQLARLRESWTKLIEDIGYQYNFISSSEIEDGELINRKYKVFIMPRSIAISDKEANEIKRFVENGGVVIADILTGRMDEHCKMNKDARGILDNLFGIDRGIFKFPEELKPIGEKKRKWDEVEWDYMGGYGENILIEFTEDYQDLKFKGNKIPIQSYYEKDTKVNSGKSLAKFGEFPSVIIKEAGKGKTVYLNFDIVNYINIRNISSNAKRICDLFGNVLKFAGLQPVVKLMDKEKEWPIGIEIFRHKNKENLYVSLINNVSHRISPEDLTDLEKNQREEIGEILINFPKKSNVYNILNNQYFGEVSEIKEVVNLFKPNIYALLPYKIKGLTVDAKVVRKGVIEVHIKVKGEKVGDHVVNLEVFDKEDKRIYKESRNLYLGNGNYNGELDLSSMSGKVKIVFKEVISGISKTKEIDIK
ncbi:MAG: beta-galactosidase [Candidatus Firestonebacteria bacterium]